MKGAAMKNNRRDLLIVLLFSALHVLFYNFYPLISGYMNMHGHLPLFLTAIKLPRVLLLLVIASLGFLQLQQKNKRLLLVYLSLFLFNLVLFFLLA